MNFFSMRKRWFLLTIGLCFFLLVGCEPSKTTEIPLQVDPNISRQDATCPGTSLPWDLSYLPNDSKSTIDQINIILQNTGLTEQGEAILTLSKQYGINPAFALSMFRKEASFAAHDTRAYSNNNPGNINATGNCKGLQANQSCNGVYGEISTDGRFGKYQSMADGIKAYYVLLSSEYQPDTKHNCADITCIITIYAPSSENNTAKYIQQVSDWTQEYQCKILGIEKPAILSAAPAQPQISSTLTSATVKAPSNNSPDVVGQNFSGQGPETWPIQKKTGMALVHVKAENCFNLTLSGKGQNIDYLPNTYSSTDQFKDQFQYYDVFGFSQFLPIQNWEANTIIDYPIPYPNYNSPPQTEVLRVEQVTSDCSWEVSVLPMSAARTISAGQLISGKYNDVIAVANNLNGLELLFNNLDSEMLQEFGGVTAVAKDGTTTGIDPVLGTKSEIFENLPSGTMYLLIGSQGYWELQGK